MKRSEARICGARAVASAKVFATSRMYERVLFAIAAARTLVMDQMLESANGVLGTAPAMDRKQKCCDASCDAFARVGYDGSCKVYYESSCD